MPLPEPLPGVCVRSAACVYHVTLVEMTDEFKEQLKQAFAGDKNWSDITKMLRENNVETEQHHNPKATNPEFIKSGIAFKLRNDMI